jgi:hypothetical protein
VLYDPDGYAREKLAQLRTLIGEKRLRRERVGRDLVWRWQEFPGFGWTLGWEGARQ